MKIELTSLFFLILIFVMGCSLAPLKPVTRQELYKTQLFNEFTIKESPESVLTILNREGEVVLEGKSRYGNDFFIKILATNAGLRIRAYAK